MQNMRNKKLEKKKEKEEKANTKAEKLSENLLKHLEEKKDFIIEIEKYIQIPEKYEKKHKKASTEEIKLIQEIYEKIKKENLGDPIKRIAYYFSRSEMSIRNYILNNQSIIIQNNNLKPEENLKALKKLNKYLNNEVQGEIRNFIASSLSSGRGVWALDIIAHLKELEYEINVDKITMTQYLKTMGYEYKKIKESVISFETNKESIFKKREIFVNFMEENNKKPYYCPKFSVNHSCSFETCDLQRDVIYLDESYININHTRGYSWLKKGQKLVKPGGLGGRICMIAAITNKGFVVNEHENENFVNNLSFNQECGSILFYKVDKTKEGSDYHENFNNDVFIKWLRVNLLPNINPNSIIVMDNAPYHTEQEKGACNYYNSNKAQLLDLLNKFNLLGNRTYLLSELREIAKENWDLIKPKSKVEQLLEHWGHTCLFLPPYHPELNPIEFVWSQIKGYVRDRNIFKANDILKNLLPNAFNSIDKEYFENIFKNVEKTMKNYLIKHNNQSQCTFISENNAILTQESAFSPYFHKF